MSGIGDIPMPPGFRYRETAALGRPQHSGDDPFRLRHPQMDIGKRAKIFAPYDALKGFSDAVAAKNELYEPRRELSGTEIRELDRRLNILCRLTAGRRRTEERRVPVTVTFFVPCADADHEAFGTRGQYRTLRGSCRGVDLTGQSLSVEDTKISFRDLLRIESDAGIFAPPSQTENTSV